MEDHYDGFKADIFSLGVCLFIMVIGNYPFIDGLKVDKYYKFIASKKAYNKVKYWELVGAQSTTKNFKSLFTKLIDYDPKKRLTLKEIKMHPWMQEECKTETIRTTLLKDMKWD